MPWIEVHGELAEHPKTLLLCEAMGWEPDYAVGKLVRLWHWCLKYAADGDLRRFNDAQLAGAMCVDLADSDKLKRALVQACWLDREPYFRIHDWWDYVGHYLKIKFKDKPDRWLAVKANYTGVTADVTGGVTQANLTNQTDSPLSFAGISMPASAPPAQSIGKSPALKFKGAKVERVQELPLREQGPGQSSTESRSTTVSEIVERELMARCREVLLAEVMDNDGGKWLNRIRKSRKWADKVERILNEMERMDKEGEVINSRGAYAEHLWEEFAP